MSYDIDLKDPTTKKVIVLDHVHHIRGGTYAVRGEDRLRLNITYNYANHFYRVFGQDGIRSIYGKTGAESIPLLKGAIAALKDDVDPDYWKSTEGNARKALCGLLAFAQLRPDGVWDGD